MRVDNGAPLGTPDRLAPPMLALWLIGIDIDMIWNKPACPQQNARVEKMQATTSRWAEISKAGNYADLQSRLDAAVVLQREQYPVRRLQGQTRLAAFGALSVSRREYSASDLAVHRVYKFVSAKLYTRRVSKSGQVTHFGQVFSVGHGYKHQWVQLRLLADGSQWEVLSDYKVVKCLSAAHLSASRIESLSVFTG